MSSDILPVESALTALLADGHSRTRATELVIERAVADARGAPTIVLVEGVSDKIAFEVVARRRGRDLREQAVAVVPMGGATNIRRFLELFADARLAGLYDLAHEGHIADSLQRAGITNAGFFMCTVDLEDELIRNLGMDGVEAVLAGEGDVASFRRMQNEPHHRGRTPEQQVHRFISGHSGRKYRYARLLSEALDPARFPRPLDELLGYL